MDYVCIDCYLAAHGIYRWPGLPGDITVEPDDEPDEHFSWSMCDACGTTVGGSRYAATITYN